MAVDSPDVGRQLIGLRRPEVASITGVVDNRHVRRLPQSARRSRGIRRRDVLRGSDLHRFLALGGRPLVLARRQVFGHNRHGGVGRAQAASAEALRRHAAVGEPGKLSALPVGAPACYRRGCPPEAGGRRVRRRAARVLANGRTVRQRSAIRPASGRCDEGRRNALFTSEAAVEAAWTVVDPVLKKHPRAIPYKPGSWGPKEAEVLVTGGGGWHNPVSGSTRATGMAP